MSVLRRWFRPQAAAAALLLAVACTPSIPASPPEIAFVQHPTNPAASHVAVNGIGSRTAKALGRLSPASEEWGRVFILRVIGADGAVSPTAVAGKYAVDGNSLRFTPLFPLDAGRRYQARYQGASSLSGDPHRLAEAIVTPPAAAPTVAVHVTEVFPTSDQVPENQLRMYIHFSGPMGRRPALEHVTLLDDKGREVIDPFLPVDGELWNSDRTRYTVFFDPGRQKRGILPNREMGPSLEAGRRYTLVVDRAWIDGNGHPLRESFKRSFLVRPADVAPLDPKVWKVSVPRAGTRDPIAVAFPAPLDHGLLMRAIGVRRDGAPVIGDVRVDAHETRWAMTPATPWTAGRYEVIALGILEDLAGNRIGRAFEVDEADRPDAEDDAAITSLPFTLLPAAR
jgi:hypothetical protein